MNCNHTFELSYFEIKGRVSKVSSPHCQLPSYLRVFIFWCWKKCRQGVIRFLWFVITPLRCNLLMSLMPTEFIAFDVITFQTSSSPLEYKLAQFGIPNRLFFKAQMPLFNQVGWVCWPSWLSSFMYLLHWLPGRTAKQPSSARLLYTPAKLVRVPWQP